MNRARPLAAVALLAAAGCLPDTKKLDPLRDAASACPVFFDLVTAKFAECQGFAPYLADRFYGQAMPGCDMVAAGEKAGRIAYDRSGAEACVAAFRAPGCGVFEGACDLLPFMPKVGVDGFCVNDLECTKASEGCFNQYPACGTGKCTTAGVTGDQCGSAIYPPCGPSHFCDTTATTAACQPRSVEGAPCSAIPCVPGLFCGVGAVCVRQGAAGSACTGYDQCSDAQNLYCDSSTSTCAPRPTAPSPLGGRCDWPYDCASQLWCDSSGATPTCQAKVPLAAACTASSACATPGATCIEDSVGSATSHCRLLLAEGAACTQGLNACQYGLYCKAPTSAPSGTCARWPGLNGVCGTVSGEYINCGEGWCNRPGTPVPPQGTCQAAVAAGQPCPNYEECAGSGFGFSRAQCSSVPGQGQICIAPCTAP